MEPADVVAGHAADGDQPPARAVNPVVHQRRACPRFTAFCDGTVDDNGFYGHGIVNALRAVS